MKIELEVEVIKNLTDEQFKEEWREKQVAMKICALIEANIECFVTKIAVK
jgi:hypothetical protein